MFLAMLGLLPSVAHAQTPGTAFISISGGPQCVNPTGNDGDNRCSSGTLSITINGTDGGTVGYSDGPAFQFIDFYIQSLVAQINTGTLVTAVDVAGGIKLTARSMGANTNYPITVQTTFDPVNCFVVNDTTGNGFTPCFDHSSYTLTPSGPTLTGGADAPVEGFINPKYLIAGVTYAPPGSQSNVTYSTSTMVGSSTNISSSFNSELDFSISVGAVIQGWSVVGVTGKVTGTSSTSYVTGSSNSSTITISKTSQQSDKTSGPADSFVGIDHDYDVIWLWLNPIIPLQIDPSNPNSLVWNGYGYDPADQPKMDIFPVFVGWLNGDIPIPPGDAAVLARSWATGQTWAAGDGPGLTGPGAGTDFAVIAQADPFWQCTPNPQACPTTIDAVRFTSTNNPPLIYQQAEVGGQSLAQTFMQNYANTDAEGSGTSSSFSQGFGLEELFAGHLFGIGVQTDIKESNKFTWNNSNLKTITTGTQDQAAVTITGPTCTVPSGANFCSPEYNGPIEFAVYQDNQYGTFMFFPQLTADFRLAATPATQKVSVGASTNYSITSTAFDGFTGLVNLSVSGVPANATASFTANPISGAGGSSTLTIATGASTTPGSYSLIITGTSGTITTHVPITLVVQDFSLSVNPASATVNAPGSIAYTITTAGLNGTGFSPNIVPTITGLPTGSSFTLSQNPIPGASTSILTITVPAVALAGNYPLNLSATSGSLTHSTQVNLTVTAPDFSISATPTTQTVTAGGNATYTVSTSPLNGFTGSVALGTSGLPTGATASFSPASISGSASSTLTVSTSSSTPPATYTVTVTGINGSIVHSTAVLLAVNAATGSVSITAPANNSNQSTSVRVTATASEPSTQIAQMQVWDNTTGVRLGINNGSSIDQTYTLAAGTHQIVVEDLAAGTFALLHTSTVTVTVFADGTHITAPANNASITGAVRVTGFATESASQIAQMQVWDNTTGVRLGINNGSTIDQTYTLAAGTHQIVMEDLAAGTFALLHSSTVTITVH
jgi:hypothetical protein